jgi:hypothetical protein
MANNIEGLFIRILMDLNQRILAVKDEYDAVKISPLLRQLLLDGNPLMSQARNAYNRRHPDRTLDIHLQVNRYDVPEKMANLFWTVGDLYNPLVASSAPFQIADSSFRRGVAHTSTFDPPPAPVIVPVNLKPNVALRRVVMSVFGYEVTALQVIELIAHIRGGVHNFQPKPGWETALNEVTDWFRVGAPAPTPGTEAFTMISGTSHTMLAIGRVTYHGLLPLHDAILVDYSGNIPG